MLIKCQVSVLSLLHTWPQFVLISLGTQWEPYDTDKKTKIERNQGTCLKVILLQSKGARVQTWVLSPRATHVINMRWPCDVSQAVWSHRIIRTFFPVLIHSYYDLSWNRENKFPPRGNNCVTAFTWNQICMTSNSILKMPKFLTWRVF